MRNVIPPASSAIETLIHPERPYRGTFTSLFYFLQIGTFRKRRNVRHLSSFLLSVILERIVFSCSASRVHSGSPVRPVSLRARNSLWHLSPRPGMIVQLSVVDPGPFSSKVEPKDCLQNRGSTFDIQSSDNETPTSGHSLTTAVLGRRVDSFHLSRSLLEACCCRCCRA
jgi:hypothetical protein